MIERPTVTKSLYHVGAEIGDGHICPDCGWETYDDCATCAADHAGYHREFDMPAPVA